MAEVARVEGEEEEQHPWLAENVVPLFRPLWAKTGKVRYIVVQTAEGSLVGMVTRVRPGMIAWQLEYGPGQAMGDSLKAPPEKAMALVERGIMELVHARGGRWWRTMT